MFKFKEAWDLRRIDHLRREKSYREGRDIMWQEVSEATGISRPTLWRARRQPIVPSAHTLVALSEYFGVPVDSWPRVLIEDTEADEPDPEAIASESDV